jgi:hypothetical protein
MKKSRFAGVFATNEALAAEDQVHEKRPRPPRSAPRPRPPAESKPAGENRKPGPGRPPGKRTSPDYQSVTTFLHKETYLSVQKALIGGAEDFGDVVDELLKAWLKRKV